MIYKRNFLGISLASRSNRRWIIAGWWLVVLILFSLTAFALKAHPQWLDSILFYFGCAIAFFAINSLGSLVWRRRPDPNKLSAGVRTLFDAAFRAEEKKNPMPDERERHQWEKAAYRAYSILVLAALLFLILHYFHFVPQSHVLRELIIWFAYFIILNLPQAIYLWTEPDMEEAQ